MCNLDTGESAKATLRSAGWFPGRAVDIGSYVKSWAGRGIVVNRNAENLCREFGGLKIIHPPHVNVGSEEYSDFTNLDPVCAVDGISDTPLKEYSKIAGESLCPVGTNRSHMTVLVGASGRVLAGVDNYLFEIGANRVEAFNRICAGLPPKKIGEWAPMMDS